ncbi:14721_t:CDS:2, partial [Racocetra persica]
MKHSKLVALKEINIDNDDKIKRFLNELKLHSKARHPHIIGLFGISWNHNNGTCCLVMEYAEGGTLQRYLKINSDRLPWSEKIKLCVQLIKGIAYLHNIMIAHLDLDPVALYLEIPNGLREKP